MTAPSSPAPPARAGDADQQVAAWAASGAMALTGPADGPPLGPPDGLVPRLAAVAARAAAAAAELGGALEVDGLALLGERAALAGLERAGTTSCGGATRLLPAPEGRWLAVTLARPEDLELVPAWLEADPTGHDVWPAVVTAVAQRPAEALAERAAELGLPVGLLPLPHPHPSPTGVRSGTGTRHFAPGFDVVGGAVGRTVGRTVVPGPAPGRQALADLVVVDLSSLWAGPLCGSLLAAAGAAVTKVESVGRPDGARRGPAPFFDLLNAGKRSVAVDLRRAEGVRALRALLAEADVVIEGSRPRALEQLGIDARAVLAAGRTRVWASITGHGRTGAGRHRVGFGDDAAVAGGLVSGPEGAPVFCADAVADPTAGLVATAAILDALAGDERVLLDVAMAGVAAHLAGPTLPVPPGVEVAPPRARPARGRGPRLGEHTTPVLGRLAP